MRAGWLAVGVGFTLAATAVHRSSAQLPLTPLKSSGQTVTPAFEGWYRNPDGTLQHLVRLLQPQRRGSRRDPDRTRTTSSSPGEQNQGQPTRVPAAPPLGRVRRQGAGRLRRQDGGRGR